MAINAMSLNIVLSPCVNFSCVFVGPSKDFALTLGEEWGWSHGPAKGHRAGVSGDTAQRLTGGTPGLGRSWAMQVNQHPGGGPTRAGLRAWEITSSSSKVEAGSLEGCTERG